MATKSGKDTSVIHGTKEFVQKLVIPRGVINPEDTIIIEIPSSMRSIPILLAERQPAYLEEILNKKWNNGKLTNRKEVIEQKMPANTYTADLLLKPLPPPSVPRNQVQSVQDEHHNKEKVNVSPKQAKILPYSRPSAAFSQTPQQKPKEDTVGQKMQICPIAVDSLPLALLPPLVGLQNLLESEEEKVPNRKRKKGTNDSYQQTSMTEVDTYVQTSPHEEEKSYDWEYGCVPHTSADNNQQPIETKFPVSHPQHGWMAPVLVSHSLRTSHVPVEVDPEEELSHIGVDRVQRYHSSLFLELPPVDYEWALHKCNVQQGLSKVIINPEFYQVKDGETQTLNDKCTECEIEKLEEQQLI